MVTSSPQTNNIELVGIISWGKGCARQGFPGSYANVIKYKSFIEKTIAPGECSKQGMPAPLGNKSAVPTQSAFLSTTDSIFTAAAPALNDNIGARAAMVNTLSTTTESIISSNVRKNNVVGISADVFVTTTELNRTPAPTKNFASSAGGFTVRDAVPTTITKRFTHLLPGIKPNMVLYHKLE